MICPYCGKKTSDQKLICEHCEKTINKECPQCAEIVRAKAKVCRFCGHEFEEKSEKQPTNVAVAAVSSTKKTSQNATKKVTKKTTIPVVIPILGCGFLVAALLCFGGFQIVRNVWDSALVSLGLSAPPSSSNGSSDLGSLPSASDPGTSNGSNASSLVVSPLAIRSSGPGDSGWTFYDVIFTLENQSSDWMPIGFDTGTGAVSTQEGFTYEGDPLHFSNISPMLFGDSLLLPPGFRVAGSTDVYNGFENTALFQFMAANDSHPESISFANYGNVAITEVPLIDSLTDFLVSQTNAGALHFPTDSPASSFHNIGETIQVADKATVTFADAYLTQYGIFRGLTIDLSLQNLNAGYENSIDEGCYMVDGLGFIRWNIGDTNFYMGPGQITGTTLGFYLWNPTAAYSGNTDASDAMVAALLSNAKIICNGEFQAIFNLD
jgi:hypothetical protein